MYVADKEFGWLPATIVSQTDQHVTVKVFSVDSLTEESSERTVALKEYSNQQLPLQNVDASGHLMEMSDMVDLPSLHEVCSTQYDALEYIVYACHFFSSLAQHACHKYLTHSL